MDTSIFKNKKLFLFDMDGTLYLGDRIFEFTTELLDTIKKSGGKYLFMTNNSSKSVNDYIKKLQKLGINACYDDFITSSQATSFYLKKHYDGHKLYVCGTESLKEELRSNGFIITEDLSCVDCVVMGFDTELTFKKLEDVCKLLLKNPEIPYIATNPDYVCPTEYGSVPDCGSVCDMIYNATKVRPFVIGKPNAMMPLLALEMTDTPKDKAVVIGDRIYTDVKSGLNAGITAVLVMSGETTEEILKLSEDKPDLVIKDCSEIIKTLKGE